jgi:ACR3 family arsenite efflux pump ArsB
MNRITKEPWFGKRRIGWGLNPESWQGWVLTLILILIFILDGLYFYKTVLFVIILIVPIICYLIVAFLTSEFFSYSRDEEKMM